MDEKGVIYRLVFNIFFGKEIWSETNLGHLSVQKEKKLLEFLMK